MLVQHKQPLTSVHYHPTNPSAVGLVWSLCKAHMHLVFEHHWEYWCNYREPIDCDWSSNLMFPNIRLHIRQNGSFGCLPSTILMPLLSETAALSLPARSIKESLLVTFYPLKIGFDAASYRLPPSSNGVFSMEICKMQCERELNSLECVLAITRIVLPCCRKRETIQSQQWDIVCCHLIPR